VQDKGTWRKRDNHEFYKLCNEPAITKYMKISRLYCNGHIIHIENSRTVTVFNTRPESTRKIRRPKLRLEDGMIQNIRALRMKNWRSAALNRQD
jgi:hypothetical protein